MKHNIPRYSCSRGWLDNGEPRCIAFGGLRVDDAIEASLLQVVEPGAVLVTWWDFSTPLWYRRLILGERPDVSVIDDRTRLDANLGSVDDVIRANLSTRPVYLVRRDEDLPDLEQRWQVEPLLDPGGLQTLLRVVGPAVAIRLPATIGP
jgi:hypothetical protein